MSHARNDIPVCSKCGADMLMYSSPHTGADKWECSRIDEHFKAPKEVPIDPGPAASCEPNKHAFPVTGGIWGRCRSCNASPYSPQAAVPPANPGGVALEKLLDSAINDAIDRCAFGGEERRARAQKSRAALLAAIPASPLPADYGDFDKYWADKYRHDPIAIWTEKNLRAFAMAAWERGVYNGVELEAKAHAAPPPAVIPLEGATPHLSGFSLDYIKKWIEGGTQPIGAPLAPLRELVRFYEMKSAPAPLEGAQPTAALLTEAMDLLENWPLPKMGNPLREDLANDRRELRKRVKAIAAPTPLGGVETARPAMVDAKWLKKVCDESEGSHTYTIVAIAKAAREALAAQAQPAPSANLMEAVRKVVERKRAGYSMDNYQLSRTLLDNLGTAWDAYSEGQGEAPIPTAPGAGL